jgi:NitT/TauT family transport system substrate-binding protein
MTEVAARDAWADALTRRRLLTRAAGFGLAAGALGLSACGSKAGGGSVNSSGIYSGQQAVTHLDDVASTVPFHVAKEEGYFKAEKLNLKSVSFPGGADVIRAIETSMKIGLGATIATIIAYNKGFKDARIVGGMMNTSEVVFYVPAKSPIRSVQDLNGKKIGVSEPGSNSTYFGNLLIQRHGLKGAKIVNVGGPPDALTGAQHGVIDVAWGSPPFTTKLVQQGKARILVDSADLEHHWATTMLVSTASFIDKNPDVMRHWLAALGKAVDLIHSDVERAAAAWARSVQINPTVATATLKHYQKTFSLQIDPKSLDSAVRAAKSLGQLKSEPDLTKLVDRRFIPAAGQGA